MIIHSILDPLEMMQRNDPPRIWQQVPGGFVEGVMGENGLSVTRLVSTDPAMYLDPRYQAGGICPARETP